MEAAEMLGMKAGHRQHADAEDGSVGKIVQVERPDFAKQEIGDDEIGKAPKDIDQRRREPLAARGGKGRLKRAAFATRHEMRKGVCEKQAAEEVGNQVEDVHGALEPAACRAA